MNILMDNQTWNPEQITINRRRRRALVIRFKTVRAARYGRPDLAAMVAIRQTSST